MQRAGCDLLVVSHASVLAANQQVYAALQGRGTSVELVVPSRWRNEYAPEGFGFEVHPALQGRVRAVSVLGQGRPQRHAHLATARSILRARRPKALLIEEEPFSIAAIRLSLAARRQSVPYGVQLAETLDRPLPMGIRRLARGVLANASFVVARSPAAARLATTWGARGDIVVVPHGVDVVEPRPEPQGEFTVAYVGRLVEEKGVDDLLDAMAATRGAARFVVAGDGPLAARVRGAGPSVVALGAVAHERIGEVYARAHVLCVPSRSTRRWQEQFGRVVTEALIRSVPVIATATGELPWLLSTTGGGIMVAERDPGALAEAIISLAADRAAAARLGAEGRQGVLAGFTNEAAAVALGAALERLSAERRPRAAS